MESKIQSTKEPELSADKQCHFLSLANFALISKRIIAPRCQLNVIIIGAGIGGLGAVLAIRHAGHHVTVLEHAAEFVEVSSICDVWTRNP